MRLGSMAAVQNLAEPLIMLVAAGNKALEVWQDLEASMAGILRTT